MDTIQFPMGVEIQAEGFMVGLMQAVAFTPLTEKVPIMQWTFSPNLIDADPGDVIWIPDDIPTSPDCSLVYEETNDPREIDDLPLSSVWGF
jgi:hypothetical protein